MKDAHVKWRRYSNETEEEKKERRKKLQSAYFKEWYLRVRRKGVPFVPLSKEQVNVCAFA